MIKAHAICSLTAVGRGVRPYISATSYLHCLIPAWVSNCVEVAGLAWRLRGCLCRPRVMVAKKLKGFYQMSAICHSCWTWPASKCGCHWRQGRGEDSCVWFCVKRFWFNLYIIILHHHQTPAAMHLPQGYDLLYRCMLLSVFPKLHTYIACG